MWFKQVQVFQLKSPVDYTKEEIQKKLETLAFTPCLPSMPFAAGFVSPIEEEENVLVRAIPGYRMICVQIEEKILPAIVVRQALQEKIKQIELYENRKVYQKEKLSLKDTITATLLPRAFSKFTRVYAYLDLKHHWLVLGTDNEKKSEQVLSLFKKAFTDKVHLLELKKIPTILTAWLMNQDYPMSFSIEKNGVLYDPKQQNRIIRCQQQDLSASSIKTLLQEGYEVKQLSLCWQDRVHFVLSHTFSLTGIKYTDAVKETVEELKPDTSQQTFDANFLMMTDALLNLLTELLPFFVLTSEVKTEPALLAVTAD